MLTQEELKELLNYDPSTGIFTWKANRGRFARVGGVAGHQSKERYVVIGINSKVYKAHRLAWLYIEGHFPENEIDHKNRKPEDNRFENLREVNRQCNVRNKSLGKRNPSGVIGVHSRKGLCKKWRANISVNKRKFNLGTFNNFIDAVKARWEGERKYNFPNCNTTSSAYLYLKEKGGL